MSKLIPIEGTTRREALRRIAGALVAAGVAGEMSPAAAQHVHKAAEEMKGALTGYKRQALTEHEWNTVTRLAELIVPADSGGGSAVDAGAVEFIDLLCSGSEKLSRAYQGGILWMDAAMRKRVGKTFADASEAEQKALLDELVAEERAAAGRPVSAFNDLYPQFRDYQTWSRSDLGPGVAFFDWVRKMSVDAYYTSPMGVADLGYQATGRCRSTWFRKSRSTTRSSAARLLVTTRLAFGL